MATEHKPPTNVNVRNPAALSRVVEAVRKGHGRNLSEAAENLIIAGYDALRDQPPSQLPPKRTNRRRAVAA
jgi:hypothetical protein